ncbi:MAG TPA: hypothetical protein VGC79_20990, partial [Polyangiaceae bacterium]
GGTAGALAALGGSGSAPAASPPPSSSLPLRPLGEIAAHSPSALPTIVAATAPPSPTVSSASNETTSAAAALAPTASSPAKPVAPPPAADLLPLPTTPRALLRQEMNCDQRKAESCIVAARSFESGSAGLTDPEKASKYRRIALTALISQCDHNSPVACATLATMYRAGSGVPQSDRNADALVARARDLCRFNDAPICHELPTP